MRRLRDAARCVSCKASIALRVTSWAAMSMAIPVAFCSSSLARSVQRLAFVLHLNRALVRSMTNYSLFFDYFGGSTIDTLSGLFHTMGTQCDHIRSGITIASNYLGSLRRPARLIKTFDYCRNTNIHTTCSLVTTAISSDTPACSEPGSSVILGAWKVLTTETLKIVGLLDDTCIYDMKQNGQIYVGCYI